ncbi:MAG: nucleotidyltransferase family protein [Planctomycetes bacterium]|nr:nucleotidyltransferase family protein [Planctomycetota bacterium]
MQDDVPISLAAIILAAGDSTRMGRPKALLDWGGKPLIERQFEVARAAGIEKIIVVLGKDALAIQGKANFAGTTVLINDHPERGQVSSMQIGMKSLDFATDAAFLWPVDCPLITVPDLHALRDAYASGRRALMRIFIPTHGGARGHPMLVDIGFRQPFMELKSDQTARTVIDANPTQVKDVPVKNAGVLVDVDTPQEYEAAKKQAGMGNRL